tara:strand:- start:117 stop:839 length:723 start_codon:yes stop_codon:yes gene_type:complete
MTNNKYSISVIIPAYNEEQSVESSVFQTKKTFEELDLVFEIIIVNDSSDDRTGEIAEGIAKQYFNIHCFHNEKNCGIGGAFKTGINHATKEYVMLVPVDNPLEPEDLKAYLPRIDICDIVVGFRTERVGYSRFASFASFTYNRILVPLLFNIGVGDVNWIQIYKKKLFSENVLTFNSTGIFFFVEILVRARMALLIIAEVPSKMKPRLHGKATSGRIMVIIQTFINMISFFLRMYLQKKT